MLPLLQELLDTEVWLNPGREAGPEVEQPLASTQLLLPAACSQPPAPQTHQPTWAGRSHGWDAVHSFPIHQSPL